MNPVMIFRGRLVMQGILSAGYITSFDRSADKYLDSDKDPIDTAIVFGEVFGSTVLFGAGTIGVWAPAVKAGVVGSIATTAITATGKVAGAAVTAAAPIAAGYAIGAVAGTAIANEVWGEEGAADAIDFYTGQGNYSEYFDVTGNISTIVDLGIKPAITKTKKKIKKGIKTVEQTVKHIARGLQLRRPKRRRWRFW
jgi:membrane-associated protease RseP (regulator of RpoE activity)